MRRDLLKPPRFVIYNFVYVLVLTPSFPVLPNLMQTRVVFDGWTKTSDFRLPCFKELADNSREHVYCLFMQMSQHVQRTLEKEHRFMSEMKSGASRNDEAIYCLSKVSESLPVPL
jgi:hypothetical protein